MTASMMNANTSTTTMKKNANLTAVGFLGLLFLLAIFTSYGVINQFWQLPIVDLFSPSASLSVADLAAQMTIAPTMLVAILAGGLLGVVSILLQQLVRNTLASDTTLAVGSGAQLALLAVTIFLPTAGLFGSFGIALLGAMVSMGLVLLLSVRSQMNPIVLILSGLIVNILVMAISSLLLIFYVEQAVSVMAWGGGMVSQSSWSSSQLLAVTAVVLAIFITPLLKPLNIMSLDDRQAKNLGVPVNAIRTIVLTLIAVATAVVVSEVGVLSFVGLGAATLVNALQVRNLGFRLFASFSLGGLLLLIASNIATLLEQFIPFILPAGALTGILGAPLVIWLILKQGKQHIDEVTPTLQVIRKDFTIKTWMIWLAGLLAISAMISIFVHSPTTWTLSADWSLISEFRLPRSLSAAATGVMLATAGVLIQTLTRNPMASPEVLGISSGAALGVLLAFFLLPMFGLSISFGLMTLSGSFGAMLVLLLILWLANRINPSYLLLVGVGISALMTGILNILQLTGDPRLTAMLRWLSGTSYGTTQGTTIWFVSIAGVLFIASLLLIQPLKVLSLGITVAHGLGVRIKLVQVLVLVLVAVMSTVSTLAVGPLSFIGLMTPHLATSLGAVELKKQLPLSALIGAMLMLIADWLGRYLLFPYEIPAGTLASVIGAGYFVWLMRQMKG